MNKKLIIASLNIVLVSLFVGKIMDGKRVYECADAWHLYDKEDLSIDNTPCYCWGGTEGDTPSYWRDPEDVDIPNPDDYEFSWSVLGDPQIVTRFYPETLPWIFDYILDTNEEQKRQHFICVGDLTDKRGDAKEFMRFKKQIERLNGVIDYTAVRGNHDTMDGYLNIFNRRSFYQSQMEACYQNNVMNCYQTFEYKGYKFMILSLDWMPTKAAVEWAKNVCLLHPQHNVIMVTHCFIWPPNTSKGGQTTVGSVDGDPNANSGSIFNQRKYPSEWIEGTSCDGWMMNELLVSQVPNIKMVFCGHECYDDVYVFDEEAAQISTNNNGGKVINPVRNSTGEIVPSIVVNCQDIDAQCFPTGLIANFYLGHDMSTIKMRYYSPIRKKYYDGKGGVSNGNNSVTFNINLIEPEESYDYEEFNPYEENV